MAVPQTAPVTSPRAAEPVTVWLESGSYGAGAAPGVAAGDERAPVVQPATRRSMRASKRAERASTQVVQTVAEQGLAVAAQATVGEGSGEGDAATTGAAHGSLDGAGGVSGSGGAGTAAVGAHGPGLRAFGHPCAGFFPVAAHGDRGEVQIAIEVDRDGHALASKVLVEFPYGEGFGSAARACAAHLSFTPAIDGTGAPIAGLAKLKLRFHRDTAS